MTDTNELYCQNITQKHGVAADNLQNTARLRNHIEILDYARFFAAFIVVLYHYTANGISAGNIVSITHTPWLLEITKYGYLGVELFFMISGYVILFSARNNSASKFAVSRAVRIYPSYIFAVLLTSFCVWQWGLVLVAPDTQTILANFTMFQFFLGFGNIDDVYWTLVYEMIFYISVLLILMSPWHNSIEKFVRYWPWMMVVALISGLQHVPLMGGYFYYFAAGALFALIRIKFDWKTAISLAMVFGFCLNFTVGKSATLGIRDNFDYSQILVAIIVACFFVFFIFQNVERVQNLKLPKSRVLGSLTYPVYLIHGNIGYILINRFANKDNKFVVYLAVLVLIIAIAYLMNRVIEVKYHGLWKRGFVATLGAGINLVQRCLKLASVGTIKAMRKVTSNIRSIADSSQFRDQNT